MAIGLQKDELYWRAVVRSRIPVPARPGRRKAGSLADEHGMKIKENAASRSDEQERQKPMNAARQSTTQHPAAEIDGKEQMLQISFSDSGGMLCKKSWHSALH